MAYDCLLAAASTVDECRRCQYACVYAHRRRRVDRKPEGAKVRGLAVLEDSEAVPDRVEACLWLLGGKFEHILRLLWWDLLAHDLTRDDSAKFHRDISAAANFDTRDIWVPEVDVVRLSEVFRDRLHTALTKLELGILRALSEEPLNDTGSPGRSRRWLIGIGEDTDARDEPVEAVVLPRREASEYVRIFWLRLSAKEL
jgi:hypothetical protein